MRAMPARDPLFGPWADASVGGPVVVHAIDGRPSYWLVPVELAGHAIGFVRVSLVGEVEAAGVHYRDPRRLQAVPAVVTRIRADDAEASAVATVPGAEPIAPPIYVHDGPPGREAWMVRLRDPACRIRLVFVTPGGTYEHQADPASGGEPG